jgi:hypothetical protein
LQSLHIETQIVKNYLILFVASGLFWFLSSCGVVLKPESPEIIIKAQELPITESYMNIPVMINLYNLSTEANSEVPLQLYKQDSIDVGANIKINLDISRRGRISVTTINGNVNTSMPIHVQGEALFSMKACGICPTIEHNQPLNADLTVITSTKLGIDTEWNIQTQTNTDFILDKAPCINVIGIPICFESITRSSLKKMLPKINTLIDQKINHAYNLKEVAENYWKQLAQPVQILDSPVKIWAVFQPTEFNFAPPVSADYNNLLLTLGVKTKIRTVVGSQPEPPDLGPLPPIENTQIKDSRFEINIPVTIELSEIKNVIKRELLGKTIVIPNSKKEVFIRDIEIIGSNKTLIIKLNIESKKTTGDIYILANPLYDSNSRNLKVENMKFDAKTNNMLVNKANWLINSFFIQSIQKKVSYDLGKDIDNMRTQLEQSVNNLPFNKGVSLKIKIQDFDIQNILFDSSYAYLNVKVGGGVNLNVK